MNGPNASRNWARHDVGTVPPQSAHVAKRCPVRAQWDLLRPAQPLAPDAAARQRMDSGDAFEAEVFDTLATLHPGAVVLEPGGPDERDDRVEQTLAAMRSGAPMVIGGRLPVDVAGRRVGEPDLLIADDEGGYHPADVKHHRTRASRSRLPDQLRSLAAPAFADPEVPADDDGRGTYKRKDDLLQLAHYRRLLEACGFASSENVGAVVGKELVVTWFDLDQPIWKTPSATEGTKLRSTMESYDFEFAFRLDIIAVSQRHDVDPSVELLVAPVRTSECSSCRWLSHCSDQMERVDDVSLLPYSGWRPWKAHHDVGIGTRRELATLDHRTALLLDAGVDLPTLFACADSTTAGTPLDELGLDLTAAHVGSLRRARVNSAGDVAALDRRIAAYFESGVGALAESIDLARARIDDSPAMIRRGHDGVDVQRGDVEIDLDLENTLAGVYLWGALVTDRVGSGTVEEGYHSFVTWDADPSGTEVDTCVDLMVWLRDLRDSTNRAGLTCTVYCYNEGVEAGALRRLSSAEGVDPRWRTWVDELVASDEWIDLLAVARESVITGQSMGLKHLAPIAGFGWDDDDAGGAQSMQWHEVAVTSADPEERAEQRRRILTYNRNDVEATLALREWFDGPANELPRLADQDAAFGWS